jgi:hypothetical protein
MEDGVLIAPALIQPRQLITSTMQAFEILKAEVKFNTVPIQPVEPSIWFLPKFQIVLKRELWRALEV